MIRASSYIRDNLYKGSIRNPLLEPELVYTNLGRSGSPTGNLTNNVSIQVEEGSEKRTATLLQMEQFFLQFYQITPPCSLDIASMLKHDVVLE